MGLPELNEKFDLIAMKVKAVGLGLQDGKLSLVIFLEGAVSGEEVALGLSLGDGSKLATGIKGLLTDLTERN